MALIVEGNRAGAEIVHGAEECYQKTIDLLEEMGFPNGLLPLRNMVECGRVHGTGFVWMTLKAPLEHFYDAADTKVSFATEVTAYVEKGRMKKITGLTSKQVFLWVPITDIVMEEPSAKMITFRTPMGMVKTFTAADFMTEEEKQSDLKDSNKSELPEFHEMKILIG